VAAPVGLDRERVVTAAVDLVAQAGRVDAVSLRQVAERLGVRTQSLYAHVEGLDGLRRAVAVVALDRLATALTDAAIGRAGPDAVEGIIRAYVRFAVEEPGLYDATLVVPGEDAEVGAAMEAVGRPLNLVFRSYGYDDTDALHWYRVVFAAVHGYALMRRDGLFTMPADPDETLDRMIAVFVRELGLASPG
jgi:AcrR family transcriptional regulator